MDINNIPKEKFRLANDADRLTDKKFATKPIGYFRDAMRRFAKNKSSVVAAIIIAILLLFAIIVPFVSPYDVTMRDGYYKMVLPKSTVFSFLGWDGCGNQKETQAGYDYWNSVGYEYGNSAVKKVNSSFTEETTGVKYYNLYVDSYERVGFVFADLHKDEYEALMAYQDENNIQVLYPIPATYKTQFVALTSSANVWYELADESETSSGAAKEHDAEGNPIYKANYLTHTNPERGGYTSKMRIAGDDGTHGENGDGWYVYAVKNQTGYRVRVLYKEYYKYKNGHYASFIFGTNQHGQDIFVSLASGARLSFILAFSVSIINFMIGVVYGSVSGYYGGVVDLVMERITDILSAIPWIVVATLFNMHLSKIVGPFIALIFAFITTGWIGIASRVRTQFYRFKNHEYILAARTLGASDKRLIFRHILPNSLGTIITGTVLIIPGVIFSESMLSYLGIINLETTGMTSVGTLLSQGQAYLSNFPHIIVFPAVFISLLEISFNLFGNGLRDAFNPSLRGVDE